MLRHVCCTGIFLFPPFVVLATAGARRVRRRRLGRGPMPVKVLAARPPVVLGRLGARDFERSGRI